jgi:hypothetical protein
MSYMTLKKAGEAVRHRHEFLGNNIRGCWKGEIHTRYVVYSYGDHFPMYIYDCTTMKWYGNTDRYSPSTSRHQSACHPPHVDEWHGTERMKMFAERGFIPVVKARLAGEAA